MRAWTDDRRAITRSVLRCGVGGVGIAGLVLGGAVLRHLHASPSTTLCGACATACVLAFGAGASLREGGSPRSVGLWMLLIGQVTGAICAATVGRAGLGSAPDEFVYWANAGALAAIALSVGIWPLVCALHEESSRPALESRARAIAITAGWITLLSGAYGAAWDAVSLATTAVSLLVMIAALVSIAHRRRWLARVRAGRAAGWIVRPLRDGEHELLPLSPTTCDDGCEVLARAHLEMGGAYRSGGGSEGVARV